jgi:hypothetical protein
VQSLFPLQTNSGTLTSCVASTFNNNQNWYRSTNKWVARITVDGVRRHIGYFHNENEAAAAYNVALRELLKKQAAAHNEALRELLNEQVAAVEIKRRRRTGTFNEVTEE